MQSPPAAPRTGPPGPAPVSGAPASSSGGGRVRPVRPPRRPGLLSVGMLLILVSAATGGWLYWAATSRVEVLTVVRPVAQGQRIQRADLDVVRVSLDPSVRAVPVREGPAVLGQTARVPLVPGSLLVRGQYGPDTSLPAGDAVVALALKAGQLPGAGVVAGDTVAVLATPSVSGTGGAAGSGTGGGTSSGQQILVRAAKVTGVSTGTTGDTTVVDLVVPFEDATTVSSAQALGQASLVLVPGGSGS
jgi:SAF domain